MQHRRSWKMAVTVLVVLFGAAAAGVAEPEPPFLGGPACTWPAASGRRLLDRQVGNVSFSHAAVLDVAKALAYQHGIPLSFIQSDPEARVTFEMSRCTVRQVLDQIVTGAPGYRYDFVGPHLVLYSTDPKWQTRIENLELAPDSRLNVSQELVARLRRQVPALEWLDPPWLIGSPNSFVYEDEVAVAGPASIVELFTQLLGSQVSLVFFVSNKGASAPASLSLQPVDLVKSLAVSAPSTILRHCGETVQLQVIGIVRDGTRQVLTAAGCGTRYTSSDEKVLAVSLDGQVTALADGNASIIVVVHDHRAKSIALNVTLPETPSHAPAP